MPFNTLPAIESNDQIISTLRLWRQQLNPVVNQPSRRRTPFNFRASSVAGALGILLSWENVRGADGYTIYYSANGDFSARSVLITLKDSAQISYFDNIGTSGVKRYYRIASTAGTVNQPQSVIGIQSATISQTTGSGTTSYDNTSHTSGSGGWNRPVGSRKL